MNQGMYGLANGQGVAGRKLTGLVSSNNAGVTVNPTGVWGTAGVYATTMSLSAGVRNRLVSVSGKGAVRFFCVQQAIAGSDTLRAELWIDGKKVIDISRSCDGASNHGINVVGIAYASTFFTAVPDYVPFDSSCELFLTATTGGTNSAAYSYRIDMHE